MADKDRKRKKPEPPRSPAATAPLSVVGVGVCAASLPSVLALFGGLAPDLGAAYVVAVRQQDGLTVNQVVEVLKPRTSFAARAAKDGDRLEAGTVYVGGGTELMTIVDGQLAIRPASEPIGHRGTVDSMLRIALSRSFSTGWEAMAPPVSRRPRNSAAFRSQNR